MRNLIEDFLTRFLNYIVPCHCVNCNQRVLTKYSLCSSCFLSVRFINGTCCPKCGRQLNYEGDSCIECAVNSNQERFYDSVQAVFHYDNFSKNLILRFKNQDKPELGKFFAKLMVPKVMNKIFSKDDLIVPVPINYKRLLERKYNQSAILSRHISKMLGIKNVPNSLVRVKNSAIQHGGVKTRFRNVKNVFAVRDNKIFANKNVILIDDVFATGATSSECAKILKLNGAKSVHVVCIAKTKIMF